jgi:hypothetical protein
MGEGGVQKRWHITNIDRTFFFVYQLIKSSFLQMYHSAFCSKSLVLLSVHRQKGLRIVY